MPPVWLRSVFLTRVSLTTLFNSGSEPRLLRYIQCWYRLPVDRYHRHQTWKLHSKGKSLLCVDIQYFILKEVCAQHRVMAHGRAWGSKLPKQIDPGCKRVIKFRSCYVASYSAFFKLQHFVAQWLCVPIHHTVYFHAYFIWSIYSQDV